MLLSSFIRTADSNPARLHKGQTNAGKDKTENKSLLWYTYKNARTSLQLSYWVTPANPAISLAALDLLPFLLAYTRHSIDLHPKIPAIISALACYWLTPAILAIPLAYTRHPCYLIGLHAQSSLPIGSSLFFLPEGGAISSFSRPSAPPAFPSPTPSSLKTSKKGAKHSGAIRGVALS